MGFNPTNEQKNAINATGSVLVSAAAGSGKTAVLVERVINLLTRENSPISADRLLIVTFTNAAAAEMRTRIEMRIDEECDKAPGNRWLAKQRLLLETAKICTIDSFCIDLLRENFEAAGLTPGFKICDPAAVKTIMETAASGILDERLAARDSDFNEFVKIIGSDTSLDMITNIILTAYEKSQSMDSPKQWLEDAVNMYKQPFCESEWCRKAFSDTLTAAQTVIPILENAMCEISAEPYVKERCEESFAAAYACFKAIIDTCRDKEWDAVFSAVKRYNFKPFKAALKGFKDADFKDKLASVKDRCDAVISSAEAIFSDTLLECERINSLAGRCTEIFVGLVNEFSARLVKELNSRNMITFNMAEHTAFELLCKKQNDEFYPTEFGLTVSSMYDEVLVDEFQDTNNLQDSLFYVLSGCGKALFIVGDAKQSIYGFRNASPENFINKKDNYPDYQPGLAVSKILLNNNFRSREGVCGYINFLFNTIMHRDTALIEYKSGEELIPGGRFAESDAPAVEIHMLETDGGAEAQARAEAKSIAQHILDSVGKPIFTDKATRTAKRPARFRDFAVLLRSPGTYGSVYLEELQKAGIPVDFAASNMFSTPEIMTVLSILKVIDNPTLEIPLLSAMTGPAFSISFDKMAEIRAKHKQSGLYSAVILQAEGGDEDCKRFLNMLSSIRLFAVTNNIVALVNKVYSSLSLLQIFSAMDDGANRRENLLAFLGLVNDYYSFEKGDLSGFLRYIEKTADSFSKPESSKSSSDAVSIMSIHKSKGLQFPCCILASSSSRFNISDSTARLVLSDKLGLGFKIVDDKFGVRVDTPARKMVAKNIKEKNISEEMRLLYVALTRAEEKLIIMVSDKNLLGRTQKIAENIAGENGTMIPPSAIMAADGYAYWILLSALTHPAGECIRKRYDIDCPVDSVEYGGFEVVFETPIVDEEPDSASETAEEFAKPSKELINQFKDRFSFVYPYADILEKPAKVTVTDLIEHSSGQDFRFSAAPASMYAGGATAAEKGTATHLFLQHVDFDKADMLDDEIARLVEWEYISEKDAELIDREVVSAFFESELFGRVKNSDFYKREQRFLFEMPISADEKFADDKTVVQGCVDLVFCENGELVIVDFKTSKYETDEEFIKRYAVQLEVYAKAMTEMFDMPVKQRIIYSLYKAKSINL